MPDAQLRLFDNEPHDDGRPRQEEEWREASRAVDKIREKFGDDAIGTGGSTQTSSTPWGPRRES
jgi:hypothetical protein